MELSHDQLRRLLTLTPKTVYKDDRRTRVHTVEADSRCWVIKTYRHPRLWQCIMWLVHRHPAQREARRIALLRQRQLQTVPLAGMALIAGVGTLVTPCTGESLFRLLNRKLLTDPHQRRRVSASVAQLTAHLLQQGLTHKDYKASNLLIDDRDAAWLIDTDRIAHARSRPAIIAMLATLDATVCRAGATRCERLRFLDTLLSFIPMNNRKALIRDILRAAARHT